MKTLLMIVMMSGLLYCSKSMATIMKQENGTVNWISTRNVPGTRSSVMLPITSYEGETLYFYSLFSITDATLKVTDADGNMIYSGIVSIPASNEISITVPELSSGDTVYLSFGGGEYSGKIQ